MTHIYRAPRPAAKERKGQLCRIVCRGRGPGPHNQLLQFKDGHLMVTCRELDRRGKPYSVRALRQLRLF
jgi:hypothetical protein